jgi:DNA-binding NarL/FixJ family response regulator
MITSLYKLGAHGYLLKSTDPKDVEIAIHSVIDTGFYFNPTISIALLRNLVKDNILNPDFNDDIFLEDDELLVVGYICEEYSSIEISEIFTKVHKIPTGDRTIERIKSAIIKKLGVKNEKGIIVYALRFGLFE